MRKYLIGLSIFFWQTLAFSFPCYLTIVKGICWKDYQISVTLNDVNSHQPMTTLVIPKGKFWNREKIACQPSQMMGYQASFSPTFWKADLGKVFTGSEYLVLPAAINPNQKAWNVTLCYPKQFSEVPVPPTAGNNCACNIQAIPPVK